MILFLFLMLLPRATVTETPTGFVIWNVGQGAASTLVHDRECLHIDMGGETFPRGLTRLCGGKHNFLVLTHFDSDHINFTSHALKELKNLCLVTAIPAKLSHRKRKNLDRLPHCLTSPIGLKRLNRSQFRFANESYTYVVDDQVLITGDAPAREERELLQLVFDRRKIRVLLLGHHGSRTSTSRNLLKALPNLILAVASSRKKRYGHPHQEVIDRLRAAAVPGLSTEDYGSFFIELDR